MFLVNSDMHTDTDWSVCTACQRLIGYTFAGMGTGNIIQACIRFINSKDSSYNNS